MLALSRIVAGVAAGLLGLLNFGLALLAAQDSVQQDFALIEKRESIYNNIFVFRERDLITMTFGHNKRYFMESAIRPSDPGALLLDYTRLMTLGVAYPPKVERVLEIGLGGGRLVSYLKAFMPQATIVAVEIDKEVVDLAKKHFGFQESEGLRAVVSDGRSFLMRDSQKWDVILIDAYRGPFVPFHLLTREFYALVKSRLTPGGVVVQNIEPSTVLYDSVAATLKQVFPSIDLYDGGGNVVAVGTTGPALKQSDLLARAAAAQKRYDFRYDLRTLAEARRRLTRASGKVLTDDFAPVETLRRIEQHNEKWKEQTEAPP